MGSFPTTMFSRRYLLRGRDADREISFPLAQGVQTVGSDPACDLVIHRRGVSRRHAQLVQTLAGLRVEDLGSKNGTFLNGAPIDSSELQSGDRLGFGNVQLAVQVVEAEDVELAIALAPAVHDTPAAVCEETPFLLSEAPSDKWLAAVEELVERLSTAPAKSLVAAVATLQMRLAASGIAVVEQQPRAEPVALACSGEIGSLEPVRWSLMRDRSRIDDLSVGSSPHQRLRGACLTAPSGDRLCLLCWGELVDGEPGAVFFRIALRLIAEHLAWTSPLGAAALLSQPSADDPQLSFPPGYVRGRSPAILEVYRQIEALCEDTLPVLITGETGVGKEGIARLLYASSPRRDQPFVAVNCAAIPAELAEAELFGIAKGVATGVAERTGRFRQAHGGTLFLDEIGEMAPPLQAKLLRVLQEEVVQPVGGAERPVDVWIVAATNAELAQRMAAGAFRSDLYYRLAGYVLEVPPLRQCRADIPRLVEHFLEASASRSGKVVRGVSVKALRCLIGYDWPGNIRQLEHEVRALVHRCAAGGAIDSSLLPPEIASAEDAARGQRANVSTLAYQERVAQLERELISEALRRAAGVRSQAASLLGISRNRLARKLKELKIEDS